MIYSKLLILLVFINFNLNAQNNSQLETNKQENITYVIKNVNIIPMTKNNKVIENATVVIDDKKILSINSDSTVTSLSSISSKVACNIVAETKASSSVRPASTKRSSS